LNNGWSRYLGETSGGLKKDVTKTFCLLAKDRMMREEFVLNRRERIQNG
jgi:hypothetical protein